jgi:hypothetical protein
MKLRSPSCVGSTVHNFGNARGPRDHPEIPVHQTQCLLQVELARHQQHRIVGLVVHAIEGLQVGDVDVLDVRAVADGGIAVVVPVVGHALQALDQHIAGGILAVLVLVAHHGHLGVQVLAAHQRIDHAVGFHRQRPLQVLVAGLHQLVVVGAIKRGSAVEASATRVEFLADVLAVLRALEQHVLEQVRHARLAITLMPRADQVGHVDGDGGLGLVGEQQHAQAIRESVFADALDLRHLRGQVGRRGARAVHEPGYSSAGEQQTLC